MTGLLWFLLGVMVSWVPSLIFLACIVLQAVARDIHHEPRGRQSQLHVNV
jgi:hypothetical protein